MEYNVSRDRNNTGNSSEGYIRVLHAAPDAPSVDVYANNQLVASSLAFAQISEYIVVPGGDYEIDIYVTGTRISPVLRNMLKVKPNTIYTIAAVGTGDALGLLAIPDKTVSMEPGKSMIRFSHLSPDATAVDITLPDGTIIFDDVSYKELTNYIDVNPMNYTLQVRLAATSTVVLNVPDVNLEQDMFYTVYAIGLVGVEQISALLVEDGITDIVQYYL